MSVKIGKVNIENKVFLAPMAGVTNEAYRLITKKMGASLVYAEMVSDKGLYYENVKTKKMIEINQAEHPISMQIFGSEAQSITAAAKYILKNSNPDIIDINMGCPVNKVVSGGSGSALLKTPEKIYDIVKSLKDNCDVPITIKIRAGWDNKTINCDEVTKLATSAGVDAIAIHGRTRAQLYTGKSNQEYIKMVRENTDVTVIGNGDITSGEDVVKMIENTSVDAVMIGRGCLGNPWIFTEANNALAGNIEKIVPTKEELVSVILEHAELLVKLKGEKVGIMEMRNQASWYFKNYYNSKVFRKRSTEIKTLKDLEILCLEYLKS